MSSYAETPNVRCAQFSNSLSDDIYFIRGQKQTFGRLSYDRSDGGFNARHHCNPK
jgi:hypothetical protein